MRYTLTGSTATLALTVANTGDKALPFSVGFHPYFAASKLDNGNFAVEVLVEPMDLMVQFQNTADLDTVWIEVAASAGITSDEQINAMSDAEYEALEARYADKVIALVRGLLPDVGYETEQSCIIQLKLNDENVYEMVGTDWQNLDGMMIDYYGSYAQ